MPHPNSIRTDIFNTDSAAFEETALRVFLYQYEHTAFYRTYCNTIRIDPVRVDSLEKIPFLPIQFFKSATITSGDFVPQVIFESSGTTGSVNSRHLLKDTGFYEESFLKTFGLFYGDIQDWCIIGLLPSYLERKSSSLVYMVNELIRRSGHASAGFYLYEHQQLHDTLLANETAGQKTLLIGVTYALLDFAASYRMQLNHTVVMETGGMKGRREELTRAEVQGILKDKLGLKKVHSEYGMTELLSQAYSLGEGIFQCPPWMKVLLRAEDDPFEITIPEKMLVESKGGVTNIIDLANLYSCSFIATDDIGKLYSNGHFEILGRLDNSDIRGCGLMIN
ncbi:acyl transferase [Ferruginibacter sp. HRS2-29]|uniref:LuxE/PaaK family acyltransferase n=1 Tax=Ferruginibacter sp. HRS2-29 TaxID=2487334 RepID=UPI0020CBE037|nr:acyl transferase [Ferruginibacter sp. HRS2-29]MCP9751096.1 acyl transferase [Ferruginibacter sp. HRS2-29]